MAFFSGTVKGYTFLNVLDHTIKNSPTAYGLDLATKLVGRYVKHGPVTTLEPADAEYSAEHLDLGSDKRLGLKYTSNEHLVLDGKIKSFYPFVLQKNLCGIGNFVLYNKLPIDLRGNILCRVLIRQNFEAMEIIDHRDNARKLVVRGPPQPEILRVSKGVRHDLIQNGLYREAFRFGDTPGVYFSELYDGVHLDSMVARAVFPLPAIPCLTFGNFNYLSYATGIRNLHLDISSFDLAFPWVLKAVTQLKRLEQLHITGCMIDRNYHKEFVNRVHITFEEIKVDHPMGSCLYPTLHIGNGEEVPGFAALQAIHNLPTPEQADRIYNLYIDMDKLHASIPMDAQWPKDCMFLIDFLPSRAGF